jgi:hypothetical protein
LKLGNYTPGFVDSYDQATRICRVRIPGVTDGAELFPEAQISYPIGDRSERTEIRILAGDRVWLDFINGDQRFPVITGYRNKESDNAIDVRRFEHANIELLADTNMVMKAAGGNMTMTADAGPVVIKAGTTVLIEAGATMRFKATAFTFDGPATFNNTLTLTGLFTFSGGFMGAGQARINGVVIDERHGHTNVQGGSDTSGGVRTDL